MKYSKETSDFLRALFSFFSVSAVFVLFMFFPACSDSSDPVVQPEDLTFQYSPNSALVTLFPDESADFSVSPSPSVQLGNQWKLNGASSGEESIYHYEPIRIGVDILRLDSTYSSVTWNRTWYISTVENLTTIPPVVSFVVLDHGPVAGDVEVSWHMISQSTYPIVEYRIAMSYEGPVTADNWADATLLGVYPHLHNQVGYNVTYTEADDGMISGEMVWFAVRGVDEVGQMSSITAAYPHLISSPWYLEGFVYGDNDETLSNVIINYGCPSCRVNTDSDGHFSIGPLPNVNVYDLSTLTNNEPCEGEPCGSFYDFVAHDVSYDPDGNYDLMLLGRYGLDDSCENYDWEFMNYFREMTRTFFPSDLRDNLLLYKWESYPVKVYIPPFVSDAGLDYQSLCQEVVGFWNIAMEDEYLQLVDTVEESMVEFYFGNESNLYAGRTYMTLPDDQHYLLGDVIPEKVMIYIWDELPNAINVQETTMHELGHSLGLYAHTVCEGDGFVMAASPSGILANGPENAVHADEKRAVRAIRNLPQGTDISAFDLE